MTASPTSRDGLASVRVAANTAQTREGIPANIDGVTDLAVGERVLLTAQSNPARNGVWRIESGAWTRGGDADTSAELTSGAEVYVSEGDTYAGETFTLVTPDPITVATTEQEWAILVPADVAAGGSAASPTSEVANARTISFQVKDNAGNDLTAKAVVQGYLSTDSAGDAPGDGGLTITPTAGTDGSIIAATGAWFVAITEADGDLDIVFTDSADAAGTVYGHLILPDGTRITSAAVAYADDTP